MPPSARPSNPSALPREDVLAAQASSARQQALERLLAQRTARGNWLAPTDPYAFPNALYVIFLRTTGLGERPLSARTEVRLIRAMLRQANSDGGFYKFVGSPSSRSLTRVAILALRLSLGEIEPGTRPPAWFRRNPLIDAGLEERVREVVARGEGFLRRSRRRKDAGYEFDHRMLADLAVAHADASQPVPRLPPLSPEVMVLAIRSRWSAGAARHFGHLLRSLLPACSILATKAQERARGRRALWRALGPRRVCPGYRRRAVRRLARHIRERQNQCGGWVFNSVYTMLDLMALVEAGADLDDPVVRRARAHLLRSIFPASNGEAFVNVMMNDIWNTCHAVCSYLAIAGSRATDDVIRPSVEFLLDQQGSDGGYAWGSGSQHDAEADSTAFVLRSLALASRTASGALVRRIRQAIRRGCPFLLSRQNSRGGFSLWHPTFVGCRRGSLGLARQILFDVASADVTARALETLAALGLTERHRPVRRALEFLARTQCDNGAWWCRWWAGYIVGTDYVLRAYGRLGLRHRRRPAAGDRLLVQSQRALERGVSFLMHRQNADGGWGETIRSDRDARYAGCGESTPLQTAFTLSALLGCGCRPSAPAVRRGIAYLLTRGTSDGRWQDQQATFTFTAGSFYYSYPFANAFLPLDALTDYIRALGVD